MKLSAALLLIAVLTACSHQPASPPAAGKPPGSTMRKPALRLEFVQPPSLGKTAAGQELFLGGFSGLRYLGKTASGELRFVTLTDRGPNAEQYEEGGVTKRPIVLPNFAPKIVYLLASPDAGTFRVERSIDLLSPKGKPVSGRGRPDSLERPVDIRGNDLPFDPHGVDPEAILVDPDGHYWVSEEYGPSLIYFSPTGKWLHSLEPGNGLPPELRRMRVNRGFEGMTRDGHRIFAALQGPLEKKKGEKKKERSSLVRIIEISPVSKKTVGQFGYLLGPAKTDRIGDLTREREGVLLAIEQNGKDGAKGIKRIYRLFLYEATNLHLLPAEKQARLEWMSPAELEAGEIFPARKEELFDLAALGVKEAKVEGLDLVDGKQLAVIVDNDFSLAGGWDPKTGRLDLKDEPPALYLLDMP